MEEKRTALVTRKSNKTGIGQRNREQIREAYSTANPNLVVIPVKEADKSAGDTRKPRVCGYCRVSTETEEQQGSFELQIQEAEKTIKENPAWDFAGIYADEGISATSVEKRKEFLRMIEDCKAGNIDLIITKSVSRFARNLVDCIMYIRLLKNLTLPNPLALLPNCRTGLMPPIWSHTGCPNSLLPMSRFARTVCLMTALAVHMFFSTIRLNFPLGSLLLL